MSDLALYLDGNGRSRGDRQNGSEGTFTRSARSGTQQNAGPADVDAGFILTLSDVLARMGLELKRDTAPVEIYRIEHIEKPSAN